MKRLDKLVLSSFLGPFILTFLVVVFILLTQHMLKYFDDIIGKGLGFDVIGQLLFYFAIFMTPVALPLAVLLSSLITYGNLGEHFELTAIKSAGVSLLRTIRPIFYFVIILTGIAFYVNNNLVPKAALEAYSLLYDIKQKKPALDLRAGTFYNGIPDINIKVNEKFPDGITLREVIIYDHRKHDGNKDVTIADSGKMYTIHNERYLKLELFDGYNYRQGTSTNQDLVGAQTNYNAETMSRNKFSKMQVVFDLSSFQLERTDKKWFEGNRIMRNIGQLQYDIDSLKNEVLNYELAHYNNYYRLFTYLSQVDSIKFPEKLSAYKQYRDSLSALGLIVKEKGNDLYDFDASINEPLIEQRAAAVSQSTIDTVRATEKKSDVLGKLPRSSTGRSMQPTLVDSGKVSIVKNDTAQEVHKQSELLEKVSRISRRRATRAVALDSSAIDESHPDENKSFVVLSDSSRLAKLDSILSLTPYKDAYGSAVNKARVVKSQIAGTIGSIEVYDTDMKVFRIQWHKILASSFACIAMFLIGAPLGAIIKKGGLGVPFLVSILFFIVYYLLTMIGEKWAKQGFIQVEVGVWAADFILLITGLIFLRQARNDARVFEADFYQVVFDKVKRWLIAKQIIGPQQQT